ncbi:MAG: sugar phosphate isomerase/epimerase, partial [Clostridia bacterium]|nr:sugar phosphate isomerase/epimerase [Clostridia bacterium]
MKQYEIGALIGYSNDLDALDADFARLQSLELNACQINVWPGSDMSAEAAAFVKASAERHGIRITAVWAG